MNKRAQFFLIAGILISIAILAIGNVYTFGDTTKQEEGVYDLSNQIQYETSQVIDNGIINAKSETQIVNDLENLTKYYAYLNPDSDITLLYGDSESSITQISYSGVDDSINQEEVPQGNAPSNTVTDKKRKSAFSLSNHLWKVCKNKILIKKEYFSE